MLHSFSKGNKTGWFTDEQSSNEERTIKMIKAAHAKMDMPVFVKRDYKRLEDVKKIILL